MRGPSPATVIGTRADELAALRALAEWLAFLLAASRARWPETSSAHCLHPWPRTRARTSASNEPCGHCQDTLRVPTEGHVVGRRGRGTVLPFERIHKG